MSEFAKSVRNVMEVDPGGVSDIFERKAVLAMRATRLSVERNEMFDEENKRLKEVSVALGAAATLTYEDLIFSNPLEQFSYAISSEPRIAEQEAVFYTAHRDIEDSLAEVIAAIKMSDFEVAKGGLRLATQKFGALYHGLDKEAFSTFRPYFVGVNDYPGPSGLFTATIPIIDLLAHGGENISDEERQRILVDVDRGLYPGHQAGELQSLLQDKDAQVEMSEDDKAEVSTLLNRFRGAHSGSVRKFVPQALDAGAEVSGGVANVGSYLASKRVSVTKGGVK